MGFTQITLFHFHIVEDPSPSRKKIIISIINVNKRKQVDYNYFKLSLITCTKIIFDHVNKFSFVNYNCQAKLQLQLHLC